MKRSGHRPTTRRAIGRIRRVQPGFGPLLEFLRVASLLVASLTAALGAEAQTVDFESLSAGDVVTEIAGVRFSHDAPGVELVVGTGESTTSGTRYLAARQQGQTGTNAGLFLPGDVLALDFDTPVQVISLTVVSTAATPPGVFELRGSGHSAVSRDVPTQQVGADEAYTLTIWSAQPISVAELSSLDGLFAFHVDDVQVTPVPEPDGRWLLVAGTTLLLMFAREPSHD